MTEFLIWITYGIATVFGCYRLYRIDYARLNFIDGLLIGSLYYLAAPMFFILLDGRQSAQFLQTDAYYPYVDLYTTLTIILSLFLFSIFHLLFGSRSSRSTQQMRSAQESIAPTNYIYIFAALYLFTTVGSFFIAGLNEGGHWHDNVRAAIQDNGLALLMKHVANFSRTSIFAVLLYYYISQRLSALWTVALGVCVIFVDFFMTFNRITAVYFVIMVLIMLRHRPLIIISLGAFGSIVAAPLSNLWPMFRGVAVSRGYSLESLSYAVEFVMRNSQSSTSIADQLNGVFESINIVALNFVIKNAGETFPYEAGAMLIRPFTVFLPSMFWPDRPTGFGVVLGRTMNDATNGLALNSTLLGEPYGNFGPFWPVFLFPLLWLFHLAFTALGQRSPMVGYVAAFCAVAMWRFDSTMAPITLLFLFVVIRGSATASRYLRLRGA